MQMKLLMIQWLLFLTSFKDSPVQSFEFSKDFRKWLRVISEDCEGTVACDVNGKYRAIDGKCNNVNNPLWGSSFRSFSRYLSSVYEDDMGSLRGEGRSCSDELPSPRDVSVALSFIDPAPANASASLMVAQWGQFLSRDLGIAPEHEGFSCCDTGKDMNDPDLNPNCRQIDVRSDPFYESNDVECLAFARSVESDCGTERREQINVATSYLDASHVYGSCLDEASNLRTFSQGLLKTSPGFEMSDPNLSFLPVNDDGDFFTGSAGVEKTPGLISLHTLFVRAHNDLATRLATVNPNKDDESIYQEIRRLIGGVMQRITFGEWLPAVIGKQAMKDHGIAIPLDFDFEGFYDPEVDITTPNVFTSSAMKFIHSLFSDSFMLGDNEVALRESFFDHNLTLIPGSYPSDFLNGIAANEAERMDHFVVRSLTDYLFARPPHFRFGSDAVAQSIQRGRDHGLKPYNKWREFCNLKPFSSYEELDSAFEPPIIDVFRKLYRDVNDIDSFPAFIAEIPNGDGLVGPVLQCLIGNHFHSVKFGDRYWFDSDTQPEPLTEEQKISIRNTNLAVMMCAYTDVEELQVNVMRIPSNENPIVSCKDIILPGSVVEKITEVF